jgi:hypothetical protein
MLIVLIIVIANIITATRLICYQRNGARYRPIMSAFAYVLIVCSGGQVIDLLINNATATVWQAGTSIIVAALILRAKGNVACVTRMTS